MVLGKVLVVEDDPDIQKLIRMSLKFRGVEEVVVANDGQECLFAVHAAMPDLILLDITMPRLDGYETCRRLKCDPRTRAIPVIFLSAKVQRGDEEIGARAGALGYLTKPFDPMTLHQQILIILEKAEALGIV
jgi:CheY-like chemotaxis protein